MSISSDGPFAADILDEITAIAAASNEALHVSCGLLPPQLRIVLQSAEDSGGDADFIPHHAKRAKCAQTSSLPLGFYCVHCSFLVRLVGSCALAVSSVLLSSRQVCPAGQEAL